MNLKLFECRIRYKAKMNGLIISPSLRYNIRRMILSMSNKIAKHSASREPKNQVTGNPHDFLLNFQMWYNIVGHPVLPYLSPYT